MGWTGWDWDAFVGSVTGENALPARSERFQERYLGADFSTDAGRLDAAAGGLVPGGFGVMTGFDSLFTKGARLGDDAARAGSGLWDNVAGFFRKPAVQGGTGAAIVGGGVGAGLWGAGLGLESLAGDVGDAGRGLGDDLAATAKSLVVPGLLVLGVVLLLRRR